MRILLARVMTYQKIPKPFQHPKTYSKWFPQELDSNSVYLTVALGLKLDDFKFLYHSKQTYIIILNIGILTWELVIAFLCTHLPRFCWKTSRLYLSRIGYRSIIGWGAVCSSWIQWLTLWMCSHFSNDSPLLSSLSLFLCIGWTFCLDWLIKWLSMTVHKTGEVAIIKYSRLF